MTALDYLKIGELIANAGKWEEKQIIPKELFKQMQVVAPGVQKKPLNRKSATRAYSIQVTTNRGVEKRKLAPEYKYLPIDSLLLLGFQGQFLVVSPSEDLIILRLAEDKGGSFDKAKFFKAVYSFLKSHDQKIRAAIETHPEKFNHLSEVKGTFQKSSTFSFSDIFKVPALLLSYSSKELCSCHFITKRSIEYCKKDLSQTLPYLPTITVDSKNKTISSKLFFTDTKKARYLSESWGCRLDFAI